MTLGVVELKTFVLYSKCIRWFNISIILLDYNNFDKSCSSFSAKEAQEISCQK